MDNASEVTAHVEAPPRLSVVVPVYNEMDCLPELHARLGRVMDAIGLPWELVFVDDGSRDGSLEVMRDLRRADSRVAVVSLSRNFGKEIATTAGLDHACGDAVIIIDADLEDPPEVIPSLVKAWRGGYEMVFAQRRQRQSDAWIKRVTAAMFYWLMRDLGEVSLPPNAGDFRLLSRRCVDALLQLRERHRFMKGLFAWIGFPAIAVPYDRMPRHAGRSKWPARKLFGLAVEGITSFSIMPLRLASYLGLVVAALAILFAAQLVFRAIVFGNPVAGYPSLMAVILFLGSVQLLTLGVIGEYLGRTFNETKGRPLYLVQSFAASALPAADRASPAPVAATRRD